MSNYYNSYWSDKCEMIKCQFYDESVTTIKNVIITEEGECDLTIWARDCVYNRHSTFKISYWLN